MKTSPMLILVLILTSMPSDVALAGISGRPSAVGAGGSFNFEGLIEPCQEVSPKASPYIRLPSRNRLFKTRVAGFRLWADASWVPVKTKATEKYDVALDHVADNVQAVVITQSGSAAAASLADLAILCARKRDPNSVLTAVENRVVNGHELVCITYESTVKAELMTFYGYLYSEDQGTVEVIGMAPQKLFPTYRAEITELLNGLEILPAGTPMTEALQGPQSARPEDMVEIDPLVLRQERKQAPPGVAEVRPPIVLAGGNVSTSGPQLGAGTATGSAAAATVDSRPVPVNSPRPNYTEDARVNGVEGFVRLRALVGAEGSVTDLRIISHLPDGLDEEAILAVRHMLFKPAMKDNHQVAYWVTLEVDFNLCRHCVPARPN
jgi:protein TonB